MTASNWEFQNHIHFRAFGQFLGLTVFIFTAFWIRPNVPASVEPPNYLAPQIFKLSLHKVALDLSKTLFLFKLLFFISGSRQLICTTFAQKLVEL